MKQDYRFTLATPVKVSNSLLSDVSPIFRRKRVRGIAIVQYKHRFKWEMSIGLTLTDVFVYTLVYRQS